MVECWISIYQRQNCCTKVQAKKTIGSPNNKEAGLLELDVLSHLPDLKIVG
jgi:hypothetical protein